MLSVNLIQRHFRARRFESLLDALAGNGMILPMPLRVRLSQHASSTVALALRRLTELTYGPSNTGAAMTAFLLDEQRPDGSWHGDPLATAVALAAITLVREHHYGAEGDEIDEAAQRACDALAGMQEPTGLFFAADDRTEQDRALTGAYILSLLAGDARFRETVRYADLMSYFEAGADRLEPDTYTLFHLAQLDEPALVPTGRAMAALAA